MNRKNDAIYTLIQPSRLKVERAKKHIADLQTACQVFLERQPFELWSRIVNNPLQREIFVKQQEAIPDEIALILGDAVHNLKSALDILAWGMVGDKAPRPKRVVFPFADTEAGLEGSIDNSQTKLAGERVIRTIKELKPYFGGDNYLYGIQTLDTIDKHRFIITTAQVTKIIADDFRLFGIGQLVGPGTVIFDVPTGQPIIAQSIAGNRSERRRTKPSEKKEDFQPAFDICFGPKQGFDGQPIVPTLLLMVATIENAVHKIGAAFYLKY